MVLWDKSCADCNWNAVCTHKKVLWDGKEYQYVTACCRSLDGRVYIPSSLPTEPLDWYLWFTTNKRIKIYGREQLVYPSEDSVGMVMDRPMLSRPRASKILPSAVVVQERDTLARPLVGLKSVYETEDTTNQGSLF